jgi:hypothetical protein
MAQEGIMAKYLVGVAGSVLIGVTSLSFPVLAQQQTLQTCRGEWKANEAALRANGMTQKAYVADCQTTASKLGAVTTAPAAADAPVKPTAATAGPAKPDQAFRTKKTVKACQEEWRTNQAALRANGITQKVFVADCQAAAAKVGTSATAPVAADPPAKPAAATIAPVIPGAAVGTEKLKACQEEWRAKRAADEVSGMTEKAYVEQCGGGGTPSGTVTPPTPSAPTTKAR